MVAEKDVLSVVKKKGRKKMTRSRSWQSLLLNRKKPGISLVLCLSEQKFVFSVYCMLNDILLFRGKIK